MLWLFLYERTALASDLRIPSDLILCASLYQLVALLPRVIHVPYASDFSVRCGRDPGFGQSFAWDSGISRAFAIGELNRKHWIRLALPKDVSAMPATALRTE